MEYNLKQHIDFLLEHACTSIRYIVHRDMLKTSIDEPFMKKMQVEILEQANVQKHLSAQCPDGWFIGGEALDAQGRGGNHAIIAQILSWVGYPEDNPIMAEQIALAQDLEILAFTADTWRNEDNVAMLAKSFQKLMRQDRKEIINTPVACWVGNHAVGPLWMLNEGYSISGDGLNGHGQDGIRRTNLEKVEWLLRCGLYNYLPELREEVDFVMNNVNSDGICSVEMYEKEFRGWSPYFGASLETDWKAKIRRQCDITFRALLIAHYAGV